MEIFSGICCNIDMKTLLFIGDSITDSHRLFLDVPHTLGDGFVSMIRQKLPEDSFSVINRGHDGFTVKDLLRCADRDCLVFDADIITILVGVNDIAAHIYGNCHCVPESFHQTYRELLKKIRTAAHTAELILMEPFVFSRPAEFLQFHPLIRQESRCIRSLAEEFNGRFITLQDIMNSQNDTLGASPLTTDGIHLSESGNHLLADRWLSAATDLLYD